MATAARDIYAVLGAEIDVERLFCEGRDQLRIRRTTLSVDSICWMILLKGCFERDIKLSVKDVSNCQSCRLICTSTIWLLRRQWIIICSRVNLVANANKIKQSVITKILETLSFTLFHACIFPIKIDKNLPPSSRARDHSSRFFCTRFWIPSHPPRFRSENPKRTGN